MILVKRHLGLLGGLMAGLALPAVARADDGRVNYLVNELLYARDDDDREDAAEDLGKLGDPAALPALERAAIFDDEDDVRDEARKAIRRIGPVAVTPAPVATAPAPAVVAPAPAVVAPEPVYAAPVVVAPAPVLYSPPPIVYAPPPPVVVAPPVFYPAPVVVHRTYFARPVCAPVYRSYGGHFSFRYRSRH